MNPKGQNQTDDQGIEIPAMSSQATALDLCDPKLFSNCEIPVLKDWVDYNGHMNVGYYVVAFDRATDAFLDEIDLGEKHLKDHGGSTFTAEVSVSYVQEVFEGDPLVFTTQLLGFDDKRIHYVHQMFHAKEGYLAAVNECLSLYVDMSIRRVSSIPAKNTTTLAKMFANHSGVAPPVQVGRIMRTKPQTNC